MSYPYQGTAVITGAGSGIGLATAKALAARGMDLALVDRRADRLEGARAALATNARCVTAHALDVTDKDVVADLPARITEGHPVVSVLMNNAGVAIGGNFEEIEPEDFDWLFEVNFHAPVRLTRAFLPTLRAAPKARIVNVSSIFGIVAPAGQTAYAASKFALRGFSEALRHELEAEGSTVGITTVHPGGVATNIAKDARAAKGWGADTMEERQRTAARLLKKPPDEAAALIAEAIERDAPRLLVGADARIAAMIQRLFPVRHFKVIASRMGS